MLYNFSTHYFKKITQYLKIILNFVFVTQLSQLDVIYYI